MVLKNYEEEVKEISKYKEWIPRVSDVVSFIYPFEWDNKERYIKWLELNNIPEEDYLSEAQLVWTFVHSQIERYILWFDYNHVDELFPKHIQEIVSGSAFVNKIRADWYELFPEYYILDSQWRYQWTSDLVAINEQEKKVRIYDWKTWWIAKKRWWLPNNVKKPYDKIKKVAIQLSMYAEYWRKEWYTIDLISVVWLHETGAYEYTLELASSEYIDELILLYKWKENTKVVEIDWNNLFINYNTMQIEMHIPTRQFEFVAIKDEIKEGENVDTKIKQMCDVARVARKMIVTEV